MKKVFSSVVVFSLFFSLFAADGLLWGEKDIRVAKTEWFDIIFPKREENSAQILFDNADRIYYEIAQDYGFPPHARMPVVLVPSVEECNAFWSWMPYNHIVIYDTESIEELEYFSEQLLSTFKHELTHAYTYNMENRFWQGVSSVMGDAVVLGRIFTTVGMAESATLTSESRGGEGRLNDEYSKQMVRQAKLEEKFPGYFDMQGSATNYPAGSFYYFNGAFAQWLQDTYGMEKYALYWYKCVNFQTLTPGMAFKKAFGESFEKAWEKFEKAVDVPEIPGNPVKNAIVKDFFNQNGNDYSVQNNSGSLYTSFSVSEKGFAFVDDRTSSVYFVNSQNYKKNSIRPKKLFYHRGLDTASVSKDGELIVFSYYDSASPTIKHKLGIYSLQTKQFFYPEETNCFKPAIVKKGSDYFILCTKYDSSVSNISLSKIDFNEKNQIVSVNSMKQLSCELNEVVNYFTDIGDGEFAFVKTRGIEPTICIWNLDFDEIAEYKAPIERMSIRYIEPCNKGLLFSWVKPGVMPRLGMLNFENDTFLLSERDISGGVYYPVELGESGKIAFTGNFFRENRLFLIEKASFESNADVVEAFVAVGNNGSIEKTADRNSDSALAESVSSFTSQPYNVLTDLTKGVWLPVSLASSSSYVPGQAASYLLPYGITHITGTPWFNNSGLLIASLGYGYETNSVGVDVSYKGGTDTSIFQYTADVQAEVDLGGFKRVYGSLDLTSTIPFGNSSRVSFAASSFTQFGKANKLFSFDNEDTDDLNLLLELLTPGSAAPATRDDYLVSNSGIGVGYGNVWKTGPGRFEKTGFSVSANLAYSLNKKVTGISQVYRNEVNGGVVLHVYIPKLVPVSCKNGFCYNLPVSLSAYLYPSGFDAAFGGNQALFTALTDIYNSDILYSLNAETILFAMDIQKGLWCTPLFVNDFRVSFVYTGTFVDEKVSNSSWKFLRTQSYIDGIKKGEIKYLDAFRVKTVLGLTPNFGASANSGFKTDFFAEFTIRQTKKGLYAGVCTLGLDLGF